MGTSRDALPAFGLPDRDPDCRKEVFQLGSVCTLLPGLLAGPWRPGPRAEFLESAATAGPSRDAVLCAGRPGALGLLGSAWLAPGPSSEPQAAVHGGPPWGAAGPSAVLTLKSWPCLRIRTVIRCWTRDVPAEKTGRERPGVDVASPGLQAGRGRCGSDAVCQALPPAQNQAALERDLNRSCQLPPSKSGQRQRVLPKSPSSGRHGTWSRGGCPCPLHQVLRGERRHGARRSPPVLPATCARLSPLSGAWALGQGHEMSHRRMWAHTLSHPRYLP